MTANNPENNPCSQCGASVKIGAKFCQKCGNPISAQSSTAPSQPGPVPQPPLPPPSTVASATTNPPTSKSGPLPSVVLSDAIDDAGVAFSQTWQSLTGKVRKLLTVGAGDDLLAPDGALPGDYILGVKPVSGKDSNVGNVRQVNEDSLIAFEFTRVQESRGVPLGFYVVADGMGGHKAGEIASRTVNKIVTEKVLNAEVIPGLAAATRRLDETPASVLTSAIQEANRILNSVARGQGSDMGTTLTAALVIGDTATIANVGDSRAYLWREGTLRQVTKDHSLVSSLVEAGVITPAEVRSHPQRNQVYRSLGVKPEVEPDIFTASLLRGDRLILCSDGLWEMVLDTEINRIIGKARSPQDACRALIQRAKDAGGDDNITVVVVKME